MGMEMEMRSDVMAVDLAAVEFNGEISDTEVCSSVVHVLNSVRMAPVLVEPHDREEYGELLSAVDPTKKWNADNEAVLVTVLNALSGAVSKIDANYHGALLNNIFALRIWNYGPDARDAVLELITRLAAVADKYLEGCLHMLVNNFLPPAWLLGLIEQPRWLTKRKEIHNQLHKALCNIADAVPFAPMKLKDVIDRSMPKHHHGKAKIVVFVECMLGLDDDKMGDILGSAILGKVVDLLTELDINIRWEDILQEEHNKGIFDMELEDLDQDLDEAHATANGVFGGNSFAETLDGLMVTMCEHLKSCADNGNLLKEFDILIDIFQRSVLRLHKSKFAQFVIFYACSLDPDTCGLNFAVVLTDIFVSKAHDPISRMSAVSYLGSYLSRAKFLSPYTVVSILSRLVCWCCHYCRQLPSSQDKDQKSQVKVSNPISHKVFYAGCQAVMYILCFRMRSIVDVPELKTILFNWRLVEILAHPLDPLKVCLPSIVQEFLRQAKAAQWFDVSIPALHENALESEFSKAFGGTERLDMFFPFDPYLLKDSDRFMRPNFEFWSMVRTTYSNCNNDDEAEFEDLDVPDFGENGINPEEDCDDVDDTDDYNLEDSIDKMSITPKHPFPSRMPARIRPSQSPP